MQYRFERYEYVKKILFKNSVALTGITSLDYIKEVDATGVFGQKEFRYSFDGTTWSMWAELSNTKINNINLTNQSSIYFEIRYTREGVGSANIKNLYLIYDSDVVPPSPTPADPSINADYFGGEKPEYFLLRENHNGAFGDLVIKNVPTSSNSPGVYHGRIDNSVGSTLKFRTITAGQNITVNNTNNSEEIVISTDASISDLNINSPLSLSILDSSPGYDASTDELLLYPIGRELYTHYDNGDEKIILSEPVNNIESVDRTIYVDASTGSDSNDGTSSGSAFASLEKAIFDIKNTVNNDVTITLDLAAGDYTLTSDSINYLSGLNWYGNIYVSGKMEEAASVSVSKGSDDLKTNLDSSTWTKNQYQGYFVEGFFKRPIVYNSTDYFYTTLNNNVGDPVSIVRSSVNITTENNTLFNISNSGLDTAHSGFIGKSKFDFESVNIYFDTLSSNTDILFYSNTISFHYVKFEKQTDGHNLRIYTDSFNTKFCIFYVYTPNDKIICYLRGSVADYSPMIGSAFINIGSSKAVAGIGVEVNMVDLKRIAFYNYTQCFFIKNATMVFQDNLFINCDSVIAGVEAFSLSVLGGLYLKNVNYLVKERGYYYKISAATGKNINFPIETPTNWFDTYTSYIDGERQILGLPDVYPERESNLFKTLINDATTNFIIGTKTQSRTIDLSYALIRGTKYQKGNLGILNDGSDLYLTESYQNNAVMTEEGYLGIDFSVSFDARDNIELNCTVDNSVNDASMNYNIDRIII